MAPSQEAKTQGLQLSLPGAPNEAHTLPGIRGWFWPDMPTPVGGDGEVSLEDARKFAKDKGCPLELVDMTSSEADTRRKEIANHRAVARKALRNVTPLTADEAERKRDELVAATGKES